MKNIRPSGRLPGDLLPVAAILAAVICWGASFVAMRITVRSLGPGAVMWARMGIAQLLLLPFSGRLWPRDYRAGDWRLLLPMVLFQPCFYFLLESNALRFTTSSQAGVIAASVPLMVAVGAGMSLAETITTRTVVGLLVSIAGVGGLTLLQGRGGGAENPLLYQSGAGRSGPDRVDPSR